MDLVVEVEHLSKTYGSRTVVRDVSLAVRRGEIFGLLGPNGAGKTTTVEALQGLRRRDAGVVSVLGMDPERSAGRLRPRIGAQLQSSSLPTRIKVREVFDLFASLYQDPVPTEQLLAEWSLSHLGGRFFGGLSGGERQRLFVALALLNRPELVFFDELTTGLDPSSRRETWRLVNRVRDLGTTVILVTHFMEEAEHLCDRLAILDAGRIVASGTPAELAERLTAESEVSFTAQNRAVAFLQSLDSVRAVTRRGARVVVTGTRFVAVDVAAALAGRGIRPEDFRTHHPTLEDAYLELTTGGSHARDDIDRDSPRLAGTGDPDRHPRLPIDAVGRAPRRVR